MKGININFMNEGNYNDTKAYNEFREKICNLTQELDNCNTLKINGISNLESLVGILVKNGYKVEAKVIMKSFPRESDIDYYEVKYFSK